MFKLYDLVRPVDDPYKSIWQIYRLDEDGGAVLNRLGSNPDIRYFENHPYWGERETYYSKKEIYCYPETFVKLVITEDENLKSEARANDQRY